MSPQLVKISEAYQKWQQTSYKSKFSKYSIDKLDKAGLVDRKKIVQVCQKKKHNLETLKCAIYFEYDAVFS